VVLEPANPDFESIVVSDHADFHVLGRVSGLFRHLTRSTASKSGAAAEAELAHA
jgi:hypothetical protein